MRSRANRGLPSPSVDIDTGALIEKATSGMRQVKDSVLDELDRVRDYIEEQGLDAGAWRSRPDEDEDEDDSDDDRP